jgi:HK97 family phage major capsid protein
MGTDVWTSLAKLRTGISGDQTPLVRPAAIQNMQFLPTTAVPTTGGSPQDGSLFVADWGDLLFGVRKDITVQVLREAFLGSNLQLAILVYARCDFMPVREASFVTLEGVSNG